jgi:DNA-binding IclR family transcriptional regulator
MAQVIRTEEVTYRSGKWQVFVGDNGVVLVGRNGRVKGGFTLTQPDSRFGRLTDELAHKAREAVR